MAGELPKIEFLDYPMKLAVWQTQKRTDSGREYTESSFRLSRMFKKQGGGYEERTITLFPNDILRLIPMLHSAYASAVMMVDVPKPKQAGNTQRR